MSLPTVHEITARYLYGSASVPDDFFSNSILTRGPLNSIQVDLADVYHPETGLSRFANASQNQLVSTFFASRERWETGEFDGHKTPSGEIEWSKEQAITALGLWPAVTKIFVSHKDFVDEVDDFAARTYIWNSMAFELGPDLTFKISSDGTMSIENFSIRLDAQTEATGDNFDWTSPNWIAQLGNDLALRPGIDPSDLAGADATGRALKLEFLGTYEPPGTTYDEADFIADQARYLAESVASNSYLVSEMNSVVQELFDEGTTRTVYADRAILYGTNGNDELIGYVSSAGYDISVPFAFLGFGTVEFPLAEFAEIGVAYITGDGDDSVIGTSVNDVFLSAPGADSYRGEFVVEAEGFDTVIHDESPTAVIIDHIAGTGDGGHAEGDTYHGIEAHVGSSHGDAFLSRTDLIGHFAGGDGADTFVLATEVQNEWEIDRSGAMVCWGGAGADEFRMESEGLVLLFEVPGLTVEGFLDLTTEALSDLIPGAVTDYDLIILNPDADDQLFVSDKRVSFGPTEPTPGPFMTDPEMLDVAMTRTGNSFPIDTFVFRGVMEDFGYPGHRVALRQIELASGATVSARTAVERWDIGEYYEVFYRDGEGELQAAGTGPGEANEWMTLVDPDFVFARSDVVATEDMAVPFTVNDSAGIRFHHIVVQSPVDYYDGQFAVVGSMGQLLDIA